MKSLIVTVLFLFNLISMKLTYAQLHPHIDIYGTSHKNCEEIMEKYGARLEEYLNALKPKQVKCSSQNKPDKKLTQQLNKKQLNNLGKVLEEIKIKYKFLAVRLESVDYSYDNQGTFITVEVVESSHPERLRFLTNTEASQNKSLKKSKLDVIEDMISYTNLGWQLFNNHEIIYDNNNCHFYHCLFGFNHQQLHVYEKKFKEQVITEKQLILNTLKNDPNLDRRGAAAYLVGFFSDPREIVSSLAPFINDQEMVVRNNVMRVIIATMSKTKLAKLNKSQVKLVLDALDSPYVSDRNKALYILLEITKIPDYHKLIIKQYADKLLALLRLNQPNNHDPAYKILKNISKKNFSENDVLAWQNWLHRHKNT